MRKELTLEPPMGLGGILVADKSYLLQLSDAEVYDLSIAVDVDGSTDLTADFPGQSWNDVWRQKTDQLVAHCCRTGKFAFCILHSGEFHVEVTTEDDLRSPDCVVSLPTGELCVVEIDSFAEAYFSGHPVVDSVLKLTPGDYSVEFEKKPGAPVNRDTAIYGTESNPVFAIKMIPRKVGDAEVQPAITRFDFRGMS